MPNKDGTGPKGQGQKTGSQHGTCEDAQPVNVGRGRCGCGRHRGLGNKFKD